MALISRAALVAAALVAAAGASITPVGATCGSANCFLATGTQEGVAASGILTVDLSYRYVLLSRGLAGSKDVSEVLTPKINFEEGTIEPDHHREISTRNTLVEVDLSYGVTPRLTLAAVLPLINERDHEHFDDVGTIDEHFTNQDGSSGFGDVRLGARYAFLVRTKNLLVGGLWVKIPTGAYRLLDSEGAINEPTIQPGTGSTDLIGSLHFAHSIAPMRVELFLGGSYRRNSGNDLDYRFGDEGQVYAGIQWKHKDRLSWSLQLNGRRTLRDRFLEMSVPSTGATFVNLTPGISVGTGSGASLYGFVQLPVYQEVNETNLAPRTGLVLGVSKSF